MNTNFVELGTYCQTEYKKNLHPNNEKYVKTLFVAIMHDDSILMSTTPHILSNASKCLLIHERLALAVTNWHSWYLVQYINQKGEVLDNRLDDDFILTTIICGSYDNQLLSLVENQHSYCYFRAPWTEKTIKSIWNLYVTLKKATTVSERRLIGSLYDKDQSILELEKEKQDLEFQVRLLEQEKNMYKGILNEIKDMLDRK